MFFEYYILLALLPLAAPTRAKGWVALGAITAGVAVSGVGAVASLGGLSAVAWAPSFDGLSALFVLIFNFTFFTVSLHLASTTRMLGADKSSQAIHYASMVALYYSLIGILRADTIFEFLFYWELMSVTAFLLAILTSARREAMHSAVSFFVMMHLGFFVLMGAFFALTPSAHLFGTGAMSIVVWSLFAVGFMIKSAVFPFHVWLPSFYQNSPSWVSALMGGAVTNIGIYGLLRVTLGVGDMALASWVMMILGAAGGLYGAFRLPGSHSLKKLLAYSSIENIGLTVLAFGLGFYCQAMGHTTMAHYAFVGGVLQLIFHAVAKTLAYLSVGHIIRATSDDSSSTLGGLVHTMPRTSLFFALASFSLMALVPMAGFFSEFMIFFAFFTGVTGGVEPLVGVVGILVVSIVASVAIFAFVRSLSVALLGVGRTKCSRSATEKFSLLDWLPLTLLALVLLGGGVLISPLSENIDRIMTLHCTAHILDSTVLNLALGVGLFVVLAVVLWLIRHFSMRGREVTIQPTWACGQGAPACQGQATDESFAREAKNTFVLPTYAQRIANGSLTRKLGPAKLMRRTTARLAFLQTGRTSHYILHIILFLTLILLLTIFGVL
ncbi:MAG: proton-conducting transporter membrane subunit [Mucinivorans sp.]